MSRRRGGGRLGINKMARGFMCGGCGGSKAVSISDGGSEKQSSPAATQPTAASSAPISTASFTTTTKPTRGAGKNKTPFSSSTSCLDADTTDDGRSSSLESTPSLSALLHQLRELERSARFLQAAGGADNDDAAAVNKSSNNGGSGTRHRRSASEGGAGRVEESVAVVKESADPLADFRRSMLQMIVEKEIVGGPELRELLHRFLSLNSPCHHHLILRAFAEIWEEVFAGYDRAPADFLAAHHARNNKR
jgi:uncharacterized protein (TIGR01568 family)